MAFALTKPSGWAFGEILTSLQMEDIDAKTADAIDGVGGGTYAPSSPITIGGDGLAVTGEFNTSGAGDHTGEHIFHANTELRGDAVLGTSASDAVDVGGTLTVAEVAEFESGLTASGNITTTGDVQAEDLHATDDLQIDGDATVVGDLTVGDDLTVADKLQVNGNTTLGSSSSDELTINAQLANRLRFSGLGRIAFRAGTLSDANQTLSVADGNCFHIPRDNTAIRTYTLSTANAVDGDFALFYTGANNEGIPAKEVVIVASDQGYTFDDDHNSQFVLFVVEGGDWWQAITSTFI